MPLFQAENLEVDSDGSGVALLKLDVPGRTYNVLTREVFRDLYASIGANCASVSWVKRPPSLFSSSNVPISTMRPWSNTRIRVALRIVASRWAMTNVVRFLITSSRAFKTRVSVWASSALVASSRIRMGGSFSSARAIDRR